MNGVIICRRRGRSSCSTTGCSGQVRVVCDYALEGRKLGQTCDRPLCLGCRRVIGSEDFCAAHAAMVSAGRDSNPRLGRT